MLRAHWLASWIGNGFHARKAIPRRPRRPARQYSPAAEVLEDRTLLSTITVNSLADTVASDSEVTLREAIIDANSTAGADTIEFDAALSGGTILLSGTQLPTITDDVTIVGLGAEELAIDAQGMSRIFLVGFTTVEVSGLTLTGGNGEGGAILNVGTLTVTESVFSGNSAATGGGAIENVLGSLSVIDSTISNNSAGVSGGGIRNDQNASLAVIGSTLSGNSAGQFGGAIDNISSTLTVTESKLSGNTAENGGGIRNTNFSTLTMTDSTVSGNSAVNGGGIFNANTFFGDGGTVTVAGSTLTRNSADENGGGVFNRGMLSVANSTLSSNFATHFGGGIINISTLTVVSSTIVLNRATVPIVFGQGGGIFTADSATLTTVYNSIVAANFVGTGTFSDDISGEHFDPASSHNLIGASNINSVLDISLADNGGPTLTHALVPGSPAIDAGENRLIPPGVTTDQRGDGFPRIVNGTVDIGAFEVQEEPNEPPVAEANGPYFVDEGSSITLSSAGSNDPDGAIAAFEWDFDFDGGTFDVDATGASPTLSAASIDGPETRTVALRVIDDDGEASEIDTALVTIHNVAPTGTFSNDGPVDEGTTATVSFSAQFDPSTADTLAGFSYSYDFDNDGTFEIAGSASDSATVPAGFLDDGPGTRTVRGRIADKDGGFTDHTTTVTINNLAPFVSAFPASQNVQYSDSIIGDRTDGALIHIQNPSFEQPLITAGLGSDHIVGNPTGWIVTGIGGPFRPGLENVEPYSDRFSEPIPDGEQIAFSNGGTISQQLSAVLEPDTEYTLMSFVGRRIDEPFPGARLELLAGTAVLASRTVTAADVAPGEFENFSLSYFASGSDSLLGEALEVRLVSSGIQTNFDDVRLSATSTSTQTLTFTATDVPADVMNAAVSYSTDGGATFTAGLPDAGSIAGGLSFAGAANQMGTGTWTVSGIADLAPGEYIIRVTASDDDGGVGTADATIHVLPEDADATYVGPLFLSTDPADPDHGVVPLRAVIRDITAFDSADYEAGLITTATVSFVNRDLLESDPNYVIASDVPVSLLNTDPKLGVATFDWNVTLNPNATAESYTIGIVVEDFYTRDKSGDDVVITVARPDGDFITGGGYLVNESSAGTYAGGERLKTNFGFNVKFNKKLTNLLGHFNAIVRRDDGTVLQIKSNATDSLGVDPTAGDEGAATFVSKANLTDVTDPHNPVGIAGNLQLIVSMTDNGEPGAGVDTIGFTLWDGSQLLFSSNFTGVQTVEQTIVGGNLEVHTLTEALHASATEAVAGIGQPLTSGALDGAIAASIDFWATTRPTLGHDATFGGVTVRQINLPGSLLGLAAPTLQTVWIDVDAAGVGWNLAGSGASGAFDLLSVVSHELGHLLGLEHVGDHADVMGESLAPGVRRLPADERQPAEVTTLAANEPSPFAEPGKAASSRDGIQATVIPVLLPVRSKDDDWLAASPPDEAGDIPIGYLFPEDDGEFQPDALFADFNDSLAEELLAV